MKKFSKIALIMLLALSVTMLVACGSGSGDKAAPQTPDNSQAAGGKQSVDPVPAVKKLKVGMDAAYKPFEYTLPNGDVAGFDVDVMQAIADAAGFEVSFSHVNWEGLFESVNNGQLDVAASAITITDERKGKYDFGNPYFEATQLILVADDANVNSLEDLKGLKIGVQQGTTGDIAVRDYLGKTYDGVKPFENIPFAIQAMGIGDVDVVVADNVVVLEYIKANPDANLKYVGDVNFEAEFYGHLVKKGNTEVLNLINEGLDKIKADGTYDKIFAEYFGN